MREKKEIKCIVVLVVILLAVALVPNNFGASSAAFAEEAAEKQYTNALDDLQRDESFSMEYYPTAPNDYSLSLVQIAESSDNELFIYVYQPSGQAKDLRASYISLSTNPKEDIKPVIYKLKYIVNTVFGAPGTGKTTLLTDMALSYEVKILNDAFEIILETDMHFPNFPWANFERSLRYAIRAHVIYDRWSTLNYVRAKHKKWENNKSRKGLYEYDYERYGLTYDNKLYVSDIWQALEDYAQAYLIYTVQSSYIISNYSIRSDKLIDDVGNFPLWNTDFFKRDSRLIDSFSRHSHILDYDMLRLGKKMLENNPNRNAFGFGVYVVTEIDKERKNSPELEGVKRDASECNQKNDLTSTCIMISRHACVISAKVFCYILLDLQRTGSLSANMLELGDVIDIKSADDMKPLLPFYSPYWFFEIFRSIAFGKFEQFYYAYRHIRTDSTLFMYLLKNLMSPLYHYHERMNNYFGSQTLSLRRECGTRDGEFREDKWYRQSKKIYSKRFATDCVSSIFEVRGMHNTVGIDDLSEYAELMATNEERLMQHSFFQRDIDKHFKGE